jgi:hypothetical protein
MYDMYDSLTTEGIFLGILSIIIIITFFVMAFRLGKIRDAVESLSIIESLKPENQKAVKCEKCGKEFEVSIVNKGQLIECLECKNPVRV